MSRLVALALLLSSPLASAQAPSYGKQIQPFFTRYCVECHNAQEPEGGLVLEGYQALMEGGKRGPAVEPGKPDASRLVRMMEGKAKPTYDGYHTSGYSIYAYLKYPNHVLPVAAKARKNDLLQQAIQPYGWQTFFIGYVQAYLPGTFKGAQPTSWADFFDVNKFPGKRAWPGAGYYDGTAEVCLLADGVAPDKLYPLDFKRANEKLESIRDHLLFYNQFPQVQQFLTSKSVALAMGPNGLFAGLQNRGVQVQLVLNNAVVTANPSTTPHGAMPRRTATRCVPT